MTLIKTKLQLEAFRATVKEAGNSLGLVPTMGALHLGHLNLVKRAAAENEVVLVTIFVNPTQFNNPEDLEKYPKTLDDDLQQLGQLQRDIYVFAPSITEMYGDRVAAGQYRFNGLDQVMEGAYREGHFEGVATIVESLLRLIQPHKAYFGEKDYQQLQIIKQLVASKKLAVEIVPCPIVREADGLAMSSRNRLLTKRLREQAGFVYKNLKNAKKQFGTKSVMKIKEEVSKAFELHPDFKLEYIEITTADTLKPVRRKQKNKKYRAFIAAYLGEVRLIDNIALN